MLKDAMRRIQHIHLIGIGGSGMGGIAEVLFNLGYRVSGSDCADNSMVQHLKKIGITVYPSHNASQIQGCDVVVASSAIQRDNPELEAAREKHIPIVARAAMLAELMRFKEGIAIAGTHGKTTTTSLIASLLRDGNEDPTFVIGGLLNGWGSNAKLGKGRFFVAEADESDASFLQLHPMIAVVTNIDKDHMETYRDNFSLLKQAFLNFIHQLPFYGLAVLCQDDPAVLEILPEVSRPRVMYGFSKEADVRAIEYHQIKNVSKFKVIRPHHSDPLPITLNLPGQHNVQNALAAIAVATELGLSDNTIQQCLEKFQGIGRRFQKIGDFSWHKGQVTLMDDYGHHPKEVEMIIESVRNGWPERRILMIYQPHRYTRTKALFEDFVSVLSKVDVLIVLDVYSAGEAPIPGADSRTLCGSIRQRGDLDPFFVEDRNEIPRLLDKILKTGDMIITQGAGDVSKIAKLLSFHFSKERTHSC